MAAAKASVDMAKARKMREMGFNALLQSGMSPRHNPARPTTAQVCRWSHQSGWMLWPRQVADYVDQSATSCEAAGYSPKKSLC